jgi:hypothetical protein
MRIVQVYIAVDLGVINLSLSIHNRPSFSSHGRFIVRLNLNGLSDPRLIRQQRIGTKKKKLQE